MKKTATKSTVHPAMTRLGVVKALTAQDVSWNGNVVTIQGKTLKRVNRIAKRLGVSAELAFHVSFIRGLVSVSLCNPGKLSEDEARYLVDRLFEIGREVGKVGKGPVRS